MMMICFFLLPRYPHLLGLVHDIAIPNIMYGVYDIQKGGRGGVVYCAMVVQQYCNRVGFGCEGGQCKDDGLPQ